MREGGGRGRGRQRERRRAAAAVAAGGGDGGGSAAVESRWRSRRKGWRTKGEEEEEKCGGAAARGKTSCLPLFSFPAAAGAAAVRKRAPAAAAAAAAPSRPPPPFQYVLLLLCHSFPPSFPPPLPRYECLSGQNPPTDAAGVQHPARAPAAAGAARVVATPWLPSLVPINTHSHKRSEGAQVDVCVSCVWGYTRTQSKQEFAETSGRCWLSLTLRPAPLLVLAWLPGAVPREGGIACK